MPAVVDDPASPTIYRVSGQPPFPDPHLPALLPADILPRKVTLRDRQTVATILPVVSARRQVPASLVTYLCGQINREIEGGDTYPMMDTFTPAGFADYWFQNFGAVMLLGDFESADDIPDSHDWARDCLGSFYIKPNYPGRSSHVCNGGLLVTDASRNRGVGRLMGESYIDWAPRLGYTYSVFNLVYETNVASCRIWDALGFKRIGRVKGCGNLKSHPDRLVDAIIYGRDLPPPRDPGDPDAVDDAASLLVAGEERFDKIRYYLKFGRYPDGADRAEKSRLRSAATHYKLLEDGETLMLKDRLVVSDAGQQYDIARNTHNLHHGGINKTTAIIAEKYHWSRIKETVSDVIRLCKECKEAAKTSGGNGNGSTATLAGSQTAGKSTSKAPTPIAGVKRSRSPTPDSDNPRSMADPPRHIPIKANGGSDLDHGHHRVLGLRTHHTNSTLLSGAAGGLGEAENAYANPSDISVTPSHTIHGAADLLHSHAPHEDRSSHQVHHTTPQTGEHAYQPIDPQIMNHHDHHGEDDALHAFDSYHPHSDFQALLHATEDGDGDGDTTAAAGTSDAVQEERDRAAVDRDLEMLIEHGDEDEDGTLLAKADKPVTVTSTVDAAGDDPGGGGQADAEMDDLEDSLRDRGWA